MDEKFIEPEPYAPLWYKAFVLASIWSLPFLVDALGWGWKAWLVVIPCFAIFHGVLSYLLERPSFREAAKRQESDQRTTKF